MDPLTESYSNLCPHCGQPHPAGALFCPNTGKTLNAKPAAPAPASAPPPSDDLTCPHCHQPVEPGWSTCPACARPLTPPPPQAKPRRRWLPWLAVNLVLVLIILGGWFLLDRYLPTRDVGQFVIQKLTGEKATPTAALIGLQSLAEETQSPPEPSHTPPGPTAQDIAEASPTPTPEPTYTPEPSPTETASPTASPTLPPSPTPIPTLARIYEWTTQIVQRSQSVGYFTSLAIDPLDYLHVGYYQDNSDLVWYGHNDSGDWKFDYVVGGQETGFHLALDLDSQNRPHIAYRLAGKKQTPEARYVRWTGTSWELFRLYGTVTAFTDLSLALDANDLPHLSFQDADSFNLTHAVYSPQTGWAYQTIDRASQDSKFLPIRLDMADNPHFAYQSQEGNLKYAFLVGGQLHREVVDETPGTGAYSDLALDQTGTPVIAYYDSQESALKVAVLVGETWQITLVDNEGDVGTFPSIAVSPNGDIHVSYYDATNQDLKYAHGRNGAWQVYTVDDFGNVGKYNSIAVDSHGLPHITYLDEKNEDLMLADALLAQP